MSSSLTHRSRGAWAEERLRRAIVSGELPPGERVRVEPLAADWEVSATPLREALRVLAGEGLIVLDAQRGARVAPVSEQEMVEVYELRLMVEPYAFRLSVAVRDDEWLARVDAAWDELLALQSRGATLLDLEPVHSAFHLALLAGCGSRSLVRLASVLSTQALRFRTLAAPKRPGGTRRSLQEHRRLRELAYDGEPDEAAEFLAQHIAWPLETIGAADRVAARLNAASRGRSPA